jgi:hypothetical protein
MPPLRTTFASIRAGAAALPLWLFAAAAARAQSDEPPEEFKNPGGTGGSAPTLGFDLNAADNLYLIWLAGALVAAVLGALFHYRAQLTTFIRNGVHPDRFAGSVYILWFGVFLLLAFWVLWTADLGVHLLLFVCFVVACLAGLLAGRLLWQFAAVVLLVMCVVGAFRYFGMVA